MRNYNPLKDFTRSRKNTGSLFAMLAIGLGIGATAALLFAPKTGKQMRKSLRRRYEDTVDSVGDWKDNANEYIERGSDWASSAKDRVAPIVKKMAR
jgi:gas vesicle protein